MKQIRILQVIGAMNRGGAEVLLMELYKKIDKSKIQFDFLVLEDKPGLFDAEILTLGGKIFRLNIRFYKNPVGYLVNLFEFFRKHQEYQCVHVHQSDMSGYMLWMAKIAKIKIRIAHSHIAYPKTTALRHFAWWIGRKLIKYNANYIFGCSSDAIYYLTGLVQDNQKIFLMNNAIDVEKFKFKIHKRESIRKELGISDHTLVVGNIARFNNQKNHVFILEIFKKLKDLNNNSILVLVGNGSLYNETRVKVDGLRLSDSVLFLGIRSDVDELLNAFDVFLMPSLYEGLGIVLIEAQANGLPCVASDVIPNEVDTKAGIMNFLSLNDSPLKWAEIILKAKREEIEIESQLAVKEAGYDIKQVATWLQEFYLNRIN